VATLVCFHAHPDDESIATGGVMAAAAEAGHRVVLVVATRGEHGEVDDGFLGDGETLAGRREKETYASAAVLGVAEVHFLGYHDSGMIGTPENDLPDAFWQADVEEAAARLAGILRAESCDVLTIYDSNGSYGHPDHIQVHRVGVRAAEVAGVTRVFEATVNQDEMRRGLREAKARGEWLEGMPDPDAGDLGLGVPASEITHGVDVRPWIDRKRASMRAHASQIAEQSFFLAMPEATFTDAFGTEWFTERGVPLPVDERGTAVLD
jgi:LmbE family N-acetylglucosaminyl deacetylase